MSDRRRSGTRSGSAIRDAGSGPHRTARQSRQPAGFPRARKRFGQHFLEPAWVQRLLAVVAPTPGDTFVEIGPGRGALTVPLANQAGEVIAVELDRDLAAALAPRLPANARVIQADFLEIDLAALVNAARTPVRVIGNLPYNVASPILFHLLRGAGEGRLVGDATLMLQREVANRLAAAPGTADYGSLSIQVQLLADVERLMSLPPGAFRPPPKVHSAVVRLRFRPPAVDVGSRERFERIVRGLFLQRRKTLANALKPVAESFGQTPQEILRRAGLDGGCRAEALSLDEVARLTRAVL